MSDYIREMEEVTNRLKRRDEFDTFLRYEPSDNEIKLATQLALLDELTDEDVAREIPAVGEATVDLEQIQSEVSLTMQRALTELRNET